MLATISQKSGVCLDILLFFHENVYFVLPTVCKFTDKVEEEEEKAKSAWIASAELNLTDRSV